MIAASPAIDHYRVVQRASGMLEVSLRLAVEEGRQQVEASVQRELMKLGERLECSVPDIRFVPYTFEPGITKLRRVERQHT